MPVIFNWFAFHFTGINVSKRHNILLNSIGVFPEETEAYQKIQLMTGLGYSLLVVLTLVQVWLFYLYNGRFHPFAKIAMKEPKSENDQSGKDDEPIVFLNITDENQGINEDNNCTEC